jgi:hypothetical protein
VDVDDDDDVAVVKEATVVRGTKGVIDDEDDADERCWRRINNIIVIFCEDNLGNDDVRMELRIDGVRWRDE